VYPHVTQFESRRQELERELQLIRELQRARRSPGSIGEGGQLADSRHHAPRYKLALLTWLGAYAVIIVLLAALGPATAGWPLGLWTLVLSVLMVATLTWLVVPVLTRVFGHWLTRTP